MQIRVNDIEAEVPDGLSVSELLTHRNVKMPDMVTVEVNGTILDRAEFGTTVLQPGDRVEFLYFMGGGGGREKEWLMVDG